MIPANPDSVPVLTRKISWEDWEKGRASRRAIVILATGKTELRRRSGDPRKDAILRRLNNGQRGMPFAAEAAGPDAL